MKYTIISDVVQVEVKGGTKPQVLNIFMMIIHVQFPSHDIGNSSKYQSLHVQIGGFLIWNLFQHFDEICFQCLLGVFGRQQF